METVVQLSSVLGVLLKAGLVETKTGSGTHLVFQDTDNQSFITLPNMLSPNLCMWGQL